MNGREWHVTAGSKAALGIWSTCDIKVINVLELQDILEII
jgi:hypothetical protein